MVMTSKRPTYDALVAARKACRACRGLTNPSQCGDSAWDSEHIGPWSRWQGNLDARLMIVGQDWGGVDAFVRDKGCDIDKNPTNETLAKLLASIRITVGPATRRAHFLKPTIELIAPRVVISLGTRAYRALRDVYALPKLSFLAAVEKPDGWALSPTTHYFPMYHCGWLVLNSHRRIDQQRRDWSKVERHLMAS
jgi:uracil-DNA glycosylase